MYVGRKGSKTYLKVSTIDSDNGYINHTNKPEQNITQTDMHSLTTINIVDIVAFLRSFQSLNVLAMVSNWI